MKTQRSGTGAQESLLSPSWWCDSEPNSELSDNVLILGVSDACFVDGPENWERYFICEQGTTVGYTLSKVYEILTYQLSMRTHFLKIKS